MVNPSVTAYAVPPPLTQGRLLLRHRLTRKTALTGGF